MARSSTRSTNETTTHLLSAISLVLFPIGVFPGSLRFCFRCLAWSYEAAALAEIQSQSRHFRRVFVRLSKFDPDCNLGASKRTLKNKACGIVIQIEVAITNFGIDITGNLAA